MAGREHLRVRGYAEPLPEHRRTEPADRPDHPIDGRAEAQRLGYAEADPTFGVAELLAAAFVI